MTTFLACLGSEPHLFTQVRYHAVNVFLDLPDTRPTNSRMGVDFMERCSRLMADFAFGKILNFF